jgi:hypothetical protein
MKDTIKNFVHERNIQNYRKRLERESLNTVADEATRKTVLKLLAEEKIEDEKTPPAK